LNVDARDSISPQAGADLLTLVRTSIVTALSDDPPPSRPQSPDSVLDEPRGAFVTLKKRGMLRGCIGRIEAEWPLWETVVRMARAAAFDDPRFPALEASEIDEVEFEISVMSPLYPVGSVEEVEPGVHGVMLSALGHRALFLPQVAAEQGWDRETLLDQLCLKAGLTPGAWRDPSARIEVFHAVVIRPTE
jgi:AmmeMemoRadiSam system protein A